MVIKIAIVEDDEESAKALKNYLARYTDENKEQIDFDISYFKDGDEIVSNYNPRFDIIFLDIQMKRLDGMSAAHYIRKIDKEVVIVFVTHLAQYAIQGYAVGALDYLLKPIPYFAFAQQLKRSIDKLKKRQIKYLLIAAETGLMKMDISEIIFIESFKHKIIIHTKEEKHILTGTMKEMEHKLSNQHFFRCNNGYLVNLAHVNSIKDHSAVLGSYNLIISRSRKKALLEALINYIDKIAK